MAVFSRFKKPESIPQSDFPKEIPNYEVEVEVTADKQVVKRLVEAEPINIYDKIQADNHGLSVYDLIKRYTNGDPNVKIGVIDWNENDFSGTTMSLVEMQTLMENQKVNFENAPLEVRKHYDSDFTKYLNGIESGEYNQWVQSLNQDKEVVKEDAANE